MARFTDVANVWRTIKEVDVQAIRDEAEQPVHVVLVGDEQQTATLAGRLREGTSGYRFPPLGRNLIHSIDLPLGRESQAALNQADLLILTLSGGRALDNNEYLAYEKLLVVDAPLLVVVAGDGLPEPVEGAPAPDWSGQRIVFHDDTPESFERIAEEIVDLLPDDLLAAAARRMVGLRGPAARRFVADVSRSNALYALTSGIPELIPILNIPLVAADMIVLTKNQALLVYRIALAMGAPGDFTSQMQEIVPVIGGGFLWRQLARELVGLIPGFGLVPKVAVAYAGTYAIGVIASRWYARHERTSKRQLRLLLRDALVEGRERATELVERYRPNGSRLRTLRRVVPRPLRRLLPGKPESESQPGAVDQEQDSLTEQQQI